MKNLKKVLAFVTMFTMLLSVAVSAGTLYPDVDDNASYAEAVETLNVLGIMIGDDKGNFNPDASITRAETAAIVTRMKALVGVVAGGTNFSDVPADHWAAGYINAAEQSGIINGYGDGNFGPSDPVTYEQVIKMVVAALGRTPEANRKGGYPSGYMIIAANENITTGVSVTPGVEAPRAAVARLVYNALEVPVMEQDGYTTGEESFKIMDGTNNTTLKTLLKDYLKVDKYEGVIDSTYLTLGKLDGDATIKIAYEKKNGIKENDIVTLLEGDTNAAALVGYNVSAYAKLNEDDEMVLLGVAKKANKNDVLVLDASLIESVTAAGIEFYPTEDAAKTESIDVDFATATYLYNGSTGKALVNSFLDSMNTEAKEEGVLTLISNDGDSEDYEVLALKKADENHVVGAINAEELTLEDRNGSDIGIVLDDETILVKFYKADGTAAEFADVAVGNTLTIYKNSKETILSVYISDVTVEGKVTEKATRDGKAIYTIGGNTYTATKSLSVGDEGTFYVNAAGEIVDRVISSTSGAYAYLYKALSTKDLEGDTVELKYLTSEGVWETKALAADVTVVRNGVSAGLVDVDDIASATEGFLKKEGGVVTEAAKCLFQYTLNSDGQINKLIIGSAAANNKEYLSLDMDYSGEKARAYSAARKMIGQISLNDETKVFTVKETINSEKDIMLTKASALFVDGVDYEIMAYDMENRVPAIAVVKAATSSILPGTNLLVVTRVSTTTNSNGNTISKVYGLQNGAEVNGEVVEGNVKVGEENVASANLATKLKAGDVVVFGLDASGAIDNIEVVMSYDAALAAIGENTAPELADSDYDTLGVAENYFGFVGEKEDDVIWMYNGFNGEKMMDGEDEVSFLVSGSDVNVYEINAGKSTPSFDTISVSKIKATTANNKEAHWAYVRVYDGVVVDVVVYKVITEKATVATPVIAVDEGLATIECGTAGATIYYNVDFAAEDATDIEAAEYDEAFAVATGDKITAWAVKDNWNNSADAEKTVE